MNREPFTIEETYNAPIGKVWSALTDRSEMKQWYFDIKEFKPEVGFEFQFYGGTEERQYLHLCKIVDVVKEQKIAYTWRYKGFEGDTLVTFELKNENGKTHVKLAHEGVETFQKDNPDFAAENFAAGWTEIIKRMLKDYLEK